MVIFENWGVLVAWRGGGCLRRRAEAVVIDDGGHGALAGEGNAGEGVVESGIVRCVEDDVGDDEFHEVLSMYRSEQGLQLWSDGAEFLD